MNKYTGNHFHSSSLTCVLLSIVDASAVAYAFYGQGTGPILMTKVACTGTESAIANCKYTTYLSGCTHGDDAGVQCVPLSGHSNHNNIKQ